VTVFSVPLFFLFPLFAILSYRSPSPLLPLGSESNCPFGEACWDALFPLYSFRFLFCFDDFCFPLISFPFFTILSFGLLALFFVVVPFFSSAKLFPTSLLWEAYDLFFVSPFFFSSVCEFLAFPIGFFMICCPSYTLVLHPPLSGVLSMGLRRYLRFQRVPP